MIKIILKISISIFLIALFPSENIYAQGKKNPSRSIKKTFKKAAARPPAPNKGSKPRAEKHHIPKKTLGPASRPVKTTKPKSPNYSPKKPTSRKEKFNRAAAPRLQNKFNRASSPPPLPPVRKEFNNAAGGGGKGKK